MFGQMFPDGPIPDKIIFLMPPYKVEVAIEWIDDWVGGYDDNPENITKHRVSAMLSTSSGNGYNPLMTREFTTESGESLRDLHQVLDRIRKEFNKGIATHRDYHEMFNGGG